MPTTLNGWPVITNPGVTRPGPDNKSDSGFANDDVADVLTAVMWWWHTEMEPVSEWGGHRKPDFNAGLANSATRSNHLSGTAQDINWTKHPFIRSRTPGSSFTSAQHALLREFDARVNGIIRWGWTFTDEMHSEIAPGTTRAQVATAAAKVRQTFVPWRTLAAVATSQRRIGAGDDGLWGSGSVAKCRDFQASLGVPRTGLWDVATDNAYQRRAAEMQRKVTAALAVREPLAALNLSATPADVGRYQKARGLVPDELAGPTTTKHLEDDMATINDIARALGEQRQVLERVEARQLEQRESMRQFGIAITRGNKAIDDLTRRFTKET